MIEPIVPQATPAGVPSLHAEPSALPAPDLGPAPTPSEPQSAILTDTGEQFVAAPQPQSFSDPAFPESAAGNGFRETTFVQAQEDFAPVYQPANDEFYFQEASAPAPLTNGFEATPLVVEPETLPAPRVEFPEPELFNDHPARLVTSESQALVVQPEPFAHQDLPASENGYYGAHPLGQEAYPEAENTIADFPYLVEDKKSYHLSPKVLFALAGAVLLAGLAAAYLFIYKPLFGASDNATTKPAVNMTDGNSAAKSTATNNDSAAPPVKPTDGKKTEEAKKVEASPTAEANNAPAGQFALQAGVFSTEANANHLADLLKRAGIPAYLAPAKANKFRVLIGRFVTNGEAQKYVPQAQARAATAGIKLELFASEINP